MKSIIITLGLACSAFFVQAQSNITLEASQMMTNFKFTSSEGTQDKEYKSNMSGAYHIGYRYAMDNGIIAQGNLGMRKGGATLNYDNSEYSWDLQYLDVRLGVGYMYEISSVKAYFVASPYFGHLLKGSQLLNNEHFDLIQHEAIQTMDYGVFLSPGAQMSISDAMSVYAQFDYMMGLNNLETSETAQQSQNVAYSISVGLVFSLNGNSPSSF